MRHPTIHGFLKWVPTAIGGTALGVAAIWSEAKDWISAQVAWGWHLLGDPLIAGTAILVLCAYIWAIIWTGQSPQEKPGVVLIGEGLDHVRVETGSAVRSPYEARFFPAGKPSDPLPPEIAALVEVKRRNQIEAALKPKFDMSLIDVLRRIAFESEWAVTRDFSSPRDHWQETMWEVPLGREFLRPLASGDIVARGIRSTKDGAEHGFTDIPAEFWLNPKLEPRADRLLLEPGYDFVMNFAKGYAYHDIRLQAVDVNREWPARSAAEIAAAPSPFVKWAEEWSAGYEERMTNEQMAFKESRAREQADYEARKIPGSLGDPVTTGTAPLEDDKRDAIRRALISKGRDIVARFRAECPSDTFETFARRQREFFDIQPHLGEEYQKRVIRNADRDVSSTADGDFLRELRRLGTEWGLT